MQIDLFDGHCDTLSRCMETGETLACNSGQIDLQKTSFLGRWAQFFAIFGEGNFSQFQAQYRLFQRWMVQYAKQIAHCRTAGEAERVMTSGRRAAFLSVEGAGLLDCSVEKLRMAYNMGVRAVNLTWNHANALSGSNQEEQSRGLSEQGKTFVQEMVRLGMLVDVSHLSDHGFWDVEECVTGPFVATHSNARNVFSHPRNLTDAQFTAIIKHNGVAGLNFFSDFLGRDPGIEEAAAHIEHFWALGGEKHVALGGDWDGISRTPRGVRDVRGVSDLYELLLKRNHSEALIRDLFYFNMMRVVREVCTTSAQEIKA